MVWLKEWPPRLQKIHATDCWDHDVNQQETNEIHTTFIDFVDRVVSLQGNLPLNKFALKCGINVDSIAVTRWIINVLDLGVSDLDLRITVNYDDLFPSRIFVSKSLVRLRIGARNGLAFGVEDVFLPKLKTLYLDSVVLAYQKICLAKLLTGCHVLEDLFLVNLWWTFWESCSVSTPTLKRLTFNIENNWDSPTSVTFDTPALVYFDYTDTVALKYENMNFDSLTEAKLGLRVVCEEIENDMAFEGQQWEGFIEHGMVGDATDLLMGIRLSASTIEVLTYCCKAIPMFNNLTHLTIESNTKFGWDPLPNLLKNCPNLKNLIFQGLIHKPPESIYTCLSSNPVKVLKILKFGEVDDKIKLEQIKHFLESMPLLEEMFIYYNTSIDDNLVKVSKQLQNIPRVASTKCKIQVISHNLNLSFTVPSSSSMD